MVTFRGDGGHATAELTQTDALKGTITPQLTETQHRLSSGEG